MWESGLTTVQLKQDPPASGLEIKPDPHKLCALTEMLPPQTKRATVPFRNNELAQQILVTLDMCELQRRLT